MNGQEEAVYAWWLSSVREWGSVRIHQALKLWKSPEKLYELAREAWKKNISQEELWNLFCQKVLEESFLGDGEGERWILKPKDFKRLTDAVPTFPRQEAAWAEWMARGGGFVYDGHKDYPKRLIPLVGHPFSLCFLGQLPREEKAAAAIVGARACSIYGTKQAAYLGEALAEKGVQILSGLAYGIDKAGHQGALRSGKTGATFAVLGSSPEICYPKEHERLYEEILEKGGGILSEYLPGTPPLPKYFPMRNRIISGLSDCILLIEARRKSGSLITVDQALEQGKEVFALPGRVGDALSEGCLELIRQGAGLLLGPEDVLEFLKVEKRENKNRKEAKEGQKNRPEDSLEQRLLFAMEKEGKTLDQLAEETGGPMEVIRDILMECLLADQVEEYSAGIYVKKESAKSSREILHAE